MDDNTAMVISLVAALLFMGFIVWEVLRDDR